MFYDRYVSTVVFQDSLFAPCFVECCVNDSPYFCLKLAKAAHWACATEQGGSSVVEGGEVLPVYQKKRTDLV